MFSLAGKTCDLFLCCLLLLTIRMSNGRDDVKNNFGRVGWV